MNQAYAHRHRIRFADCDPAGIVYFPRFLEMVNDLTENWFGEGLGTDFHEFHIVQRYGVPVVNTRIEFLKACRLMEPLELELRVQSLGRSSAVLAIRGHVNGEDRLRLRHKVAMMSLDTYRATPIPEGLRARMQDFLVDPPVPATPDPVTHDGQVPACAFRAPQPLRFAHCDPAGIGFYPRYFDLFNAVMEDWFAQGLGCPWGTDFMGPRNLRIPALAITVEFQRASRMGELLDFDLWVTRMGRSTLDLALQVTVKGEPRLRVAWTVCMIDFTTFKSTPIPEDLKQRIRNYMPTQSEGKGQGG